MADNDSAWLDDPSLEPAGVMDIHAICPTCAQPVQNPTPVLIRAPHVNEALCICANEHTWITKWTTDTDPGNEAA